MTTEPSPDFEPDENAIYHQNLLDEADDGEGSRSEIGIHVNQKPKAPPSPTALQVDLWGMQRGKELAANKEFNVHQHDALTLADMHAASFEPFPEMAEQCTDKLRQKWMESLLDSPEYHALKSSTVLDVSLSEVAGFTLANQYKEYVATLTAEEKAEIEGGGEEGIGNAVKRMRSTGSAIKGASDDVSDAKDAQAGIGGMGALDGTADPANAMRIFKRIRKDRSLKGIVQKMGRYLRLAQSLQRQKKTHGLDDVVGVELSGDVNRILPTELALLGDPDLEFDMLRRIAEKQAMSRKYQGLEGVAKGPIVVCVDESGSMHGAPHENAKAFAAALGWIAKSQNRWCAFVGYSDGTEGTRIAFPPNQWDSVKFMDWLTHFYSGGTTLDVPLEQLPKVYWPEFNAPKGKTDVVIITDAYVDCPQKMADQFNAWKAEEKVRCYGIIIGSEPGDLELVCDQTWKVDTLNVEEDCVSELLSI